jgi:hypothetical protein
MGGDVPLWPLAIGIVNAYECCVASEQWRERFDALVARRSYEAARAAIPPYVAASSNTCSRES